MMCRVSYAMHVASYSLYLNTALLQVQLFFIFGIRQNKCMAPSACGKANWQPMESTDLETCKLVAAKADAGRRMG